MLCHYRALCIAEISGVLFGDAIQVFNSVSWIVLVESGSTDRNEELFLEDSMGGEDE